MNKLAYGMSLSFIVATLVSCSGSPKIKYDENATLEPDYETYQKTVFENCGNASEVWTSYRGKGVTICIIDSGFDTEHPEFINQDGTTCISDKSAYIYTTAGGTIKTEVGIDKVNITDGDSHGTMCASLAASRINGVGIIGMAPESTLMFVKIDKKATSMAKAFSYAADNGAKVICTSLGEYQWDKGGSGDIIYSAGFDLTTAFNEDIKYAHDLGCVVVAAAGNSHTTRVSYPAGCEYVIGAGGLIASDKHHIWGGGDFGSNYNGDVKYVDCYAPSNRIYAAGYDFSKNEHVYWGDGNGTSFASPLIAGAACLYFEKHPKATNVDFERDLEASCFDLSSYNTEDMGWGQLDVVELLKK